ncbi:unnamed protein product [Absidia cylindrospora]
MTPSPPLQLNQQQRNTITTILDTFLAPLSASETAELQQKMTHYPAIQSSQVALMAQTAASTQHQVVDALVAFLQRSMPEPVKQHQFLQFLGWLESPAGMAVLSQGHHITAWSGLMVLDRAALMHRWRHSRFTVWRQLYQSLAALTWAATYMRPEAAETLHKAIGYPTFDPVRSALDYTPVYPRPRLVPLTTNMNPQQYDVIVIGSGAGGGVVAARAAMAGLSVLVLEKGPYYHESDYVLHEGLAAQRNLERGGTFLNEQATMGFMAGSLVGGGTSINYSASLKLPHYVRKEWADLGLPYFTSNKFMQDTERVCERIGATTDGIQLHGSNQILMDGCKNLGYHHEKIAQNSGGHPHECHWCLAGCRDGIKNGSMNTWLRDAMDHGARLMVDQKVERVVIDPETEQATGVVLANLDIIRARRVVVSAGTLQSPGILQRSGLTSPHVGAHLRVHPCVATYGYFDHVVDTHQGTMMTAYSDVVANFQGDHYGAKIEGVSHHPGMMANATPWHGALDHKYALLRWRYATPLLTVSRDKDSVGNVFYDNDGLVKVNYTMSKRDQRSVLEGIVASAKILVAAGAREVRTMQPTVRPFVFAEDQVPAVDHPRFQRWIKTVRAIGCPALATTPHQMGTCRMGASASNSVVKPTGETWQVKGLYVADASVFRTSSGVNPMVTIMAISLHIADQLVQSFTDSAKL